MKTTARYYYTTSIRTIVLLLIPSLLSSGVAVGRGRHPAYLGGEP